MHLSLLEGALGGIGLFLLGMRLMSGGIRTVANGRIRSIFALFTSNRFYSFFFGMVLSLSLNSASAALIFTIGLANGGVLNIFQAISVLGGVLVGASLTLHFPGIPYSLVATPLIFTGVILKFFARRRRLANAGDLLLGAGLLFLGLTLLENCFRPYNNHPLYHAFEGLFFRDSFLSMIFGGMISCFVMSTLSSVTVIGSLIASHHLGLETASIMVLGGIIGVASIGGLASIGGTSVSRRIAAIFFMITLLAILPLVAITPYLQDFIGQFLISPIIKTPRLIGQQFFEQLTWIHTIASLLTAAIATVLSGPVSRILGTREAPHKNRSVPQPCANYLDVRIINTPTLAIEQSRKEIIRMMTVTSFMYADIRELFSDFDSRRAATIMQHEEVLDSLNHEITSFLAVLARSCANPEISYDIPGLLQTVTDLEHIGDRCVEILECIIARKETNVIFSDVAMDDLKRLSGVVGTTFLHLEDYIKSGNTLEVGELHNLKTDTRAAFDLVKRSHFDRICVGVCPPRATILFNELMDAFVRIAELCWNVLAIQRRKTL